MDRQILKAIKATLDMAEESSNDGDHVGAARMAHSCVLLVNRELGDKSKTAGIVNDLVRQSLVKVFTNVLQNK